MRDETVCRVRNSRYHAIRRLIAFSPAADVTIQRFHGAPQLITEAKEATNHDSEARGLDATPIAFPTF